MNVQINGSHAFYSVKVIEMFDVKIVYAINRRVYASRQYGSLLSHPVINRMLYEHTYTARLEYSIDFFKDRVRVFH